MPIFETPSPSRHSNDGSTTAAVECCQQPTDMYSYGQITSEYQVIPFITSSQLLRDFTEFKTPKALFKNLSKDIYILKIITRKSLFIK